MIELFISLQHKKCWFCWLCLESGLFFRRGVIDSLVRKTRRPKNWARLMFVILFWGIISNWGCCVKRGLLQPLDFSSNHICALIPELLMTGWLTEWVEHPSIAFPLHSIFGPLSPDSWRWAAMRASGEERERRMQRWQQSSNAFIENVQGVPRRKTWICFK